MSGGFNGTGGTVSNSGAGNCSGPGCQDNNGAGSNGGSSGGGDDEEPATVTPSVDCSVVLLGCHQDDEVLGTFYTLSDFAYPQTQSALDPADRMLAEFTPVWWVNVVILLHDLTSIPPGSNFVAKYITHEHVYAIVKYDIRRSAVGTSPYITGFRVVNNTNSQISVK
jgi:hypothetical protein